MLISKAPYLSRTSRGTLKYCEKYSSMRGLYRFGSTGSGHAFTGHYGRRRGNYPSRNRVGVLITTTHARPAPGTTTRTRAGRPTPTLGSRLRSVVGSPVYIELRMAS
jgi:hypothetical protein